MTIRVAFPFVGDSVGGSHVSAALLMRHLPAHGFAPVAIIHDDGPLQAWLAKADVPILRTGLPYLRSDAAGAAALGRVAAMAPPLAMFLRREKFQLVHANDGRMIATWMLAARAAFMASVAHRRTRWSPSRMSELSFRLAGGVVAISEFVRQTMPEPVRARAVVVHNPFEAVAVSRAAGQARVKALVGADAPVVAFVGTLQAQKRPDVFLRAAAVAHRQRPDVRFLMLGRDGEAAAAARALIEECALSGAVTLAGFQDGIVELLAGCDVLLAPAVDEGHGRALVEAMTAGVAVVAADSGGQSEVVQPGRTGLTFPPGDAAAAAAAILDLLQQPEKRRGMAAAARDWATQSFSPERHARAIAALYRRLLRLDA